MEKGFGKLIESLKDAKERWEISTLKVKELSDCMKMMDDNVTKEDAQTELDDLNVQLIEYFGDNSKKLDKYSKETREGLAIEMYFRRDVLLKFISMA